MQQLGHYTRECQEIMCNKCKNKGYKSDKCPNLAYNCNYCNQPGHQAHEFTQSKYYDNVESDAVQNDKDQHSELDEAAQPLISRRN